MKKYKALMLDLDGTTVPNNENGMPSERVRRAIIQASKNLHVGVVTGRPYYWTQAILDSLALSGPSIFSGGANIVDSQTKQVLWEERISQKTTQSIFALIQKHQYVAMIQQESLLTSVPFDCKEALSDCILLSVMDLASEQAEEFVQELSVYKDISVHKVIGWKKGTLWVQVTNRAANKQHAILEIAKIMGIETHEIIGVGDSYNDFPLLMACGLKVAMGNGAPELQAIADYVAPSVEDDGVADVIEKFVMCVPGGGVEPPRSVISKGF